MTAMNSNKCGRVKSQICSPDLNPKTPKTRCFSRCDMCDDVLVRWGRTIYNIYDPLFSLRISIKTEIAVECEVAGVLSCERMLGLWSGNDMNDIFTHITRHHKLSQNAVATTHACGHKMRLCIMCGWFWRCWWWWWWWCWTWFRRRSFKCTTQIQLRTAAVHTEAKYNFFFSVGFIHMRIHNNPSMCTLYDCS